MRKRLLLSLIFSLAFLTLQIFAGSTGKIAGLVKDKETGEPLPFANVFIDGTSMGAATDIDGNFTILNVPPGVYSITASVVGYQKVTITDTRVNVDFTTRIEFELSSGSVTMEAVVVQGVRDPLIRQDLTNPTVAINAETIQELPVDQISDVIKLQAGVTVGDDGAIHMRGGFGNETSYTLNGVSLNDPYNNKKSVGLATNAVQEVSVSSGTFSAEYGNALSGLVNYVTKEGGNKLSFSLRGYAGDYVTSRTELFENIDEIDPLNRGRLEATIGGPLIFQSLKFFVSGVYENYGGLYYGKRLYNTTDSYLSREAFASGDYRKESPDKPYWFNPYSVTDSTGLPTGDGEYVAMNPSTSLNLQGNVSFNITTLMKLKYEAVFNKGDWKNYNFAWQYNPDGRGTNYQDGLVQTIDFTHTVSQNVFYTLKASHGYNQVKYYLYEDEGDTNYLPSIYELGISNTGFVAGGTHRYRSDRKTTTMTVKGDLVAQMGNHELKFGFEGRQHNLELESYNVEILKANGSKISNADMINDPYQELIRRKPTSLALLTEYDKDPVDAAVYIVDKMELAKRFIFNVGLRYEYFDPKAQYNSDMSGNLEDLGSGKMSDSLKDATAKHYLSPRLSISYPITAESVIRFSYGHFYQNGSLSSLYRNPEFFVTNVGSVPTFGNPNVEMQRSVQYELGLQHQLMPNLKMELTGYYKDVRDYIQFQTVKTLSGTREYSVLTNLAYSNVRGVSFRLERRRAPEDMFYATMDYTYQIAEGNRTEPADWMFFSEASGKQTETYLVPMSFNRSHVINISFGLYKHENWTLGLIYNLQSGKPYTPNYPPSISTRIFIQNESNQLTQNTLDFKFEKFFRTGDFKWSLFLWVANVLDFQNELSVWASSGRALTSVLEETDASIYDDIRGRIESDPGLFDMSAIDNYYARPDRVSRPREIRLGFSVIFN
ncbi:MAG: TonB-dependent receptor [Bacteroidota bacterium]